MSQIFDEVLILGGGLIGSSIARAAKQFVAAKKVHIWDSNKNVRTKLLALGLCDDDCDNNGYNAKTADLVILAVPPGKIAQLGLEIAPDMKKGAILSDVGSIKKPICNMLDSAMPQGVEFIGAHPIAGTEQSGPEAGFARLFENRWCVLTPENDDSEQARKLSQFWQKLGSNIAFMSAERHDLVLATTSHLPHLIAYALVGTATDMETVTKNEVVKYSAGGFRDFTRIAASDPIMWRDVFLGNKDAVLEVLGRYIEDLTALKRAIRWEDGEFLMQEFVRTRDIRKKIIDAGQDSDKPNFGRDNSKD